jgi:pyruvate dehydrogenase E2 component (dihydrolipoyllysine-residue acetyltransferase)
MATNVIMPALELAQETGKLIRWIKAPGDTVRKGEPIAEVETDKVTIELEAPAAGVLRDVTAREGDVVPVGHTIAVIAAVGEPSPLSSQGRGQGEGRGGEGRGGEGRGGEGARAEAVRAEAAAGDPRVKASPLARKVAEEHGVDLARVKTASGKIEKADVLAYVESQRVVAAPTNGSTGRLVAASPKARRLAAERGIDLRALKGSGPGGAVLEMDLPLAAALPTSTPPLTTLPSPQRGEGEVGTVWRIMAERMTASWTTAPHFYLVREVNVTRLVAWLAQARKQTGAHITYTDLLVKLVAATLAQHPRVAVSWKDGRLERHADVNIGLAVALDDGLVVPVLHRVDTLGLKEIATRREDVVSRAQAGKLRPADIQGGVFTISNLGMYGVDAFNAIVNPPQAAILAVGRIADRVVPVDGRPAVQPTMVLTLSCDHRAVDGARGAQFLGALADLVEEPLALLV